MQPTLTAPDYQTAFEAGQRHAATWFAQHGRSVAVFRDQQRALFLLGLPGGNPLPGYLTLCQGFADGLAASIAGSVMTKPAARNQDPQVLRDLKANPFGALGELLRAIEDTTFQDSRKAIYRLEMIRELARIGRYVAQQLGKHSGGAQ